MMEFENIKYTTAAIQQIEKFKLEQAKKLEQLIVENKKFPGSDFIEITASDIQEEAKRFLYQKPKLKSDLRYLLVYAYFIIGIGLMLFGFFYEEIINIWFYHPEQALYIITGFFMTVMSGFLFRFVKNKEKRRNDSQIVYSEYVRKGGKLYFKESTNSFNESVKNINKEMNKSNDNKGDETVS